MGRTHVWLGAESRTAAVAGSAAGTTSCVCQSPTHSRRARPSIAASTRGEGGTGESTLIWTRRGGAVLIGGGERTVAGGWWCSRARRILGYECGGCSKRDRRGVGGAACEPLFRS